MVLLSAALDRGVGQQRRAARSGFLHAGDAVRGCLTPDARPASAKDFQAANRAKVWSGLHARRDSPTPAETHTRMHTGEGAARPDADKAALPAGARGGGAPAERLARAQRVLFKAWPRQATTTRSSRRDQHPQPRPFWRVRRAF